MWNTFPKETELTEEKLSDDKFIPLFKKYLNIIKVLNKVNSLSKKELKLSKEELGFINSNRLVNQQDKCHYCKYYSFYCKPQCEAKK